MMKSGDLEHMFEQNPQQTTQQKTNSHSHSHRYKMEAIPPIGCALDSGAFPSQEMNSSVNSRFLGWVPGCSPDALDLDDMAIERAAILEFDAGFTRPQAERMAQESIRESQAYREWACKAVKFSPGALK